MSDSDKSTADEIDDLLEELLVDAYGDDEQLTALHQGVEDAIELPIDVLITGQPMSLVGIDYDGNARRGLMAQCLGNDGRKHRVSFADVQIPPQTIAYRYLAAYCGWLGIEPVGLSQVQGAGGLSGRIVSSRADAEALGLPPLSVNSVGMWDPTEIYRRDGRMGDMSLADETGADGDASTNAWFNAIMERGARPMYEMQQVLPGFDPDDADACESDPIIQANELRELEDFGAARQLLSDLLEADLRCIDAHAHLGSMAFDRFPQQAHDHYAVGVVIGEKALGSDFDGVLPWGYLDNRPFLRCLHGLGLSLWRLGRWNEAQQAFEQILELSPMDELDVLSMLPDVKARRLYADMSADA